MALFKRMFKKMLKKDKPYYVLVRKRCPKCRATKIYKRTRINDYSNKCKCYMDKSKTITKSYICRKCNYEFDIPFVDQN